MALFKTDGEVWREHQAEIRGDPSLKQGWKFDVLYKDVRKHAGTRWVHNSPEPLVSKRVSSNEEALGVLFGEGWVLKYFDMETNKVSKLIGGSKSIWAIYADENEVFYNLGGVLNQLFELNVQVRSDWPQIIQKHKGKILDAGWYGLYSLDDCLISKEEFEKRNILCINSLTTDKQDNLYCSVRNNNDSYSFLEIDEDNGKYFLGDIILNYEKKHEDICQAITIPYGETMGENGKKYPSSILSCVNLKYLDLNGEKILGTDVLGEVIRVEQLSLFGNKLEVIYSGKNLNQIIKAKIDLDKKEVIEREVLVDELGYSVLALQPVFSRKLHELILERVK